MADLAHWFGNDLTVAANGDLLTVNEPFFSEQRIVRRLLTNPGDYIWHNDYGAGLALYIGQPAAALTIKSVVATQIALEASVAQQPVPIIQVIDSLTGVFTVTINYFNNNINGMRTLSFSISQ